MTDISVNTGCRTNRCRNAGRCSCLHVYDDGTPVPGDGSQNNPYVHAQPPIVCVLDSNGAPIPPDQNRCITLPPYAKGLRVGGPDGTILYPNANGEIIIPADFISGFSIFDSDGTELFVQNGGSVLYDIDGGPSQSYGLNNNEWPIITGNTVVFPTMKVVEQAAGNIGVGSGLVLPLDGTTVPVFDPMVPVPALKNTNYNVNLDISMQNDSPTGNPGQQPQNLRDFVEFEVLFTFANVTQVPYAVRRAIWSADYNFGYHHYSFHTSRNQTGAPLTNYRMGASLRVTNTNLPATETLLFDANMIVSWV